MRGQSAVTARWVGLAYGSGRAAGRRATARGLALPVRRGPVRGPELCGSFKTFLNYLNSKR
jgi:hypothetical protein